MEWIRHQIFVGSPIKDAIISENVLNIIYNFFWYVEFELYLLLLLLFFWVIVFELYFILYNSSLWLCSVSDGEKNGPPFVESERAQPQKCASGLGSHPCAFFPGAVCSLTNKRVERFGIFLEPTTTFFSHQIMEIKKKRKKNRLARIHVPIDLVASLVAQHTSIHHIVVSIGLILPSRENSMLELRDWRFRLNEITIVLMRMWSSRSCSN